MSHKNDKQMVLDAPAAVNGQQIEAGDERSLVATTAEEVASNLLAAEANAASFAWYQAGEQPMQVAARMEMAAQPEKLAIASRMPGPRRYELGRFAVAENHEIVFEAIPQLGEVSYSEFIDLRAGQRLPEAADDDRSVLQKYLAVTSKEIPVPQMLLDLDDDVEEDSIRTLLRGRDLVESAGSIAGSGGIVAAPPPTAAAVSICGGNGAQAFENAYCLDKGINYCDNGIWYDLVRSSGSAKRKYSHSITGSCQSTAVVYHYYWAYWFGWKWFFVQHPLIQQFVPHGSVKYWKHKGGKKRRRKVERHKTNNGSNPSAGFRSWTGFYN
ncbi:MAG: hypothetical protein R3A44_40445 [Caldilineaceae bacterium]